MSGTVFLGTVRPDTEKEADALGAGLVVAVAWDRATVAPVQSGSQGRGWQSLVVRADRVRYGRVSRGRLFGLCGSREGLSGFLHAARSGSRLLGLEQREVE